MCKCGSAPRAVLRERAAEPWLLINRSLLSSKVKKPDAEVRIRQVDFLFHFPPPALFFFGQWTANCPLSRRAVFE